MPHSSKRPSMLNKRTYFAITVLLLLASLQTVFAADTLNRKIPAAVLVQLRAEKNRITTLTAARRYKQVEEVKNDAKKVADAMINDFQDNFNHCPVYYFMDSNAEAVKNKQFDGILLNADGRAVTDPVVNSASNNYLIVYYGYPNYQERRNEVSTDQLSPYFGRGLIILNHEYEQIAYIFLLSYNEHFYKRNKRLKKYNYHSKRFDMQYIPFAAELQAEIPGAKHYKTHNRGYFRGSLKSLYGEK